ncbi:MAG TPA: hypothetical protein VFY03_12150 [Woeseiaceae bacterium]|nr:hypothetical protein [Woeseiaceae bacterium]
MPALLFAALLLAGCATERAKPDLPYPAFVDTAEIEEQFLAALPGVRARVFASDARTRALSSRVDIPPDWKGTTGGEPGLALEIYVLAGQLNFSDIELGPGGYAYVPPGSMGFRLVSDDGAQVLYFLNEVEERTVIRSPIILDSGLLPWEERGPGVYERELRRDPGTGARTWLVRVTPEARFQWAASSVEQEGYLVSGQFLGSECAQGEPVGWEYLPGGYFRRPAGVLSGGPDAAATAESTWFLRELTEGTVSALPACVASAAPEEVDEAEPSRDTFGDSF